MQLDSQKHFIQSLANTVTSLNRKPIVFDSAIAQAPATCGELIQGIKDDGPFLVNAPIPLFSIVRASITSKLGVRVIHLGIYTKIIRAIEFLLIDLELTNRVGVELQVLTHIPRGKGLASSTSEISAALGATLKALNLKKDPSYIAHIIHQVEANDAVYYPFISMVNQDTGLLYASYIAQIPLGFLLMDTGGEVLTDEISRKDELQYKKNHEGFYKRAIDVLPEAFEQKDLNKLSELFTKSAKINQGYHKKEIFDDVLKVALSEGALGVNCAHTGTLLGVMYDIRRPYLHIKQKLLELVEESSILGSYQLCHGGIQ